MREQKKLPFQPLRAEDEFAECIVDAGGNNEVQKWQLGQNFFEKLRDVHEGVHGRSSWFRRFEHNCELGFPKGAHCDVCGEILGWVQCSGEFIGCA
jgi:hypothetical protein